MNIIVTGIVEKGDQYGRTLGFPTANLHAEAMNGIDIAPGVYAGTARLENNDEYIAGIVVRERKDENNMYLGIEAHLIDFDKEIYGKKLEIHLMQYMREYKHESNVEKLKKMIQGDMTEIRKTISLNT